MVFARRTPRSSPALRLLPWLLGVAVLIERSRPAFLPSPTSSPRRSPRLQRRERPEGAPELGEVVLQGDAALLDAKTGPEYPVQEYNFPILAFVVVAAAVLVLRQDLITIYALYYFAPSMEANWVTEAVNVLGRLPTDLLQAYGEAAATQPLITKACTSGVAYVIGDLMAQAFEGRRRIEWLDLPRSIRNGLAGFFLHGPGLHYWILFLEGPVTSALVGWGPQATVLAKIALDQTVFSFALNVGYALVLGALAGKSIEEIFKNTRATIGPAMFSSWRFWPFVHLVTYSPMMPIDFKVLWNDVMEVIWVAILSVVANSSKEPTTGSDPETKNLVVEEDFGVEPAVEITLASQVESKR